MRRHRTRGVSLSRAVRDKAQCCADSGPGSLVSRTPDNAAMRSILRGKTELVGIKTAEIDPVELIRAAPDWELFDQDGFRTADLKALFVSLEATTARRKRRLPSHLDDPLLAELIDRPEYKVRPDLPLAISNALLILCQIPDGERTWADSARWLKVAAHHQLHSFAVIFAFADRGRTFEVRTRSDRRRDLARSTEALATALMSRKPFTFEPAQARSAQSARWAVL
jgi:hypothetical protein